jgi:hypothetical protein
MRPKVIVFARSPKAGAAFAAALHLAIVTDLIGQLQQLSLAVDLELDINLGSATRRALQATTHL